MKKIHIDPGHGDIDSSTGAYDPGAVGLNGNYEANLALKVGLKLGELLEDEGYGVVFSRKKDKVYDVWPIIDDIYWNNDCDMLISIHYNACSDRSVTGTEVFYNVFSSSGKKLAEIIQNNLIEKFRYKDRGICSNPLRITNIDSNNPVVLVEVNFISNSIMELEMCKEEHINNVAYTLLKSVKQFYGTKLESEAKIKTQDTERQIIKNMIRRVSAEYGLDYTGMLAHAIIESQLDPDAVSSSNALGIGQVKLTTAQEIAREKGWKIPQEDKDLLGISNAEYNFRFMCEYVLACKKKTQEMLKTPSIGFVNFLNRMLYLSGKNAFAKMVIQDKASEYANKVFEKEQEISRYTK